MHVSEVSIWRREKSESPSHTLQISLLREREMPRRERERQTERRERERKKES